MYSTDLSGISRIRPLAEVVDSVYAFDYIRESNDVYIRPDGGVLVNGSERVIRATSPYEVKRAGNLANFNTFFGTAPRTKAVYRATSTSYLGVDYTAMEFGSPFSRTVGIGYFKDRPDFTSLHRIGDFDLNLDRSTVQGLLVHEGSLLAYGGLTRPWIAKTAIPTPEPSSGLNVTWQTILTSLDTGAVLDVSYYQGEIIALVEDIHFGSAVSILTEASGELLTSFEIVASSGERPRLTDFEVTHTGLVLLGGYVRDRIGLQRPYYAAYTRDGDRTAEWRGRIGLGVEGMVADIHRRGQDYFLLGAEADASKPSTSYAFVKRLTAEYRLPSSSPTYSKITAAGFVSDAVEAPVTRRVPELLLFPNPASDYFDIATDEEIEIVRCYDAQGREYQLPHQGNRYLTNGLPPGFYVVVARFSGHQIARSRLVVN